MLKQNEPPYDKTNKMTCAPSEDSDQAGHPTGRMPRLVWVSARSTGHFIGFVVLRLKYVRLFL